MKLLNVTAGAVIAATGFCSAAFATTDLNMWYHGAGDGASKTIFQIVADFNASQSDWKVDLQTFPQNSYNDAVTTAALAGKMPDILDMDGPIMPNWAWSGYAVIYLTGHGDVPMAVDALQAGAVNFFQKPVKGDELAIRALSTSPICR